MARVTIKDIAEQADVSPATVSRFLNKRYGSMSPETRDRIARVIERTGYKPNNAARSLRLDRTNTIGVILADIGNPFSSAMLEELSQQAAQRGCSIVTAISSNDAKVEAEALERLVDAGVDGIIVNACSNDPAALRAISATKPVVLLDRDVEGVDLSLVTSNNAALIDELLDELQQAGCTRYYLLTEHDETSSVRRGRADRFEHEICRRGLTGCMLALDPDANRAAAQISACLEPAEIPGDSAGATSCKPITGFIAINGLVFLRFVEALGLTDTVVPRDALVATFDEYPWNHVLFGGVTTAMQDTAGLATAALEQLFTAIDQLSRRGGYMPAPRHVEVPGAIIPRASSHPR